MFSLHHFLPILAADRALALLFQESIEYRI